MKKTHLSLFLQKCYRLFFSILINFWISQCLNYLKNNVKFRYLIRTTTKLNFKDWTIKFLKKSSKVLFFDTANEFFQWQDSIPSDFNNVLNMKSLLPNVAAFGKAEVLSWRSLLTTVAIVFSIQRKL